jgi:hypothetical protein
MKTIKISLEQEWYETLKNRKTVEGITLDFQLREAVKVYVELLNKKENERHNN